MVFVWFKTFSKKTNKQDSSFIKKMRVPKYDSVNMVRKFSSSAAKKMETPNQSTSISVCVWPKFYAFAFNLVTELWPRNAGKNGLGWC